MRNTKNPETVILALSLDKKRNRKRVVIGEERQVHMRIRRIGNSDVLYDKERTLGPLIFDHEKQLDKDWNIKVIHPLRNALSATADRENRAASILKHLEQNEQSDDPIYIFTSYQCRKWYNDNKDLIGSERAGNQFAERIMCLTKSFKQIIREEKQDYSTNQMIGLLEEYVRICSDSSDTEARIWYPGGQRNAEYLVITDSFIPAIYYYLLHIKEWGIRIRHCDVCGQLFLAPSNHYNLCSDACRKEKGRQNKRAFDARAKKNKYDSDYKIISLRMRYRMKSSFKRGLLSDEQVLQIYDAFQAFRKEAIQLKKGIKAKEDCKTFENWLIAQEQEFEKLCEACVPQRVSR